MLSGFEKLLGYIGFWFLVRFKICYVDVLWEWKYDINKCILSDFFLNECIIFIISLVKMCE